MLDTTAIKGAIRRAAGSVVFQWPDVIEHDDLEQELWVWLLERPSAREKLAGADPAERHKLLVRQGHLIASRTRIETAIFNNEFHYTVDEVKAILVGEDRSASSLDDLEEAMDLLRERNEGYADAIKRKYGEKLPPGSKQARDRLYHAHIALTDIMNAIVRSKFDGFNLSQTLTYEEYQEGPVDTLGDGPGSRTVVFGESRYSEEPAYYDDYSAIEG